MIARALRVTAVAAAERWDQFVATHPEATYAHQSGWRRLLGDALGHDCRYLAAVDDAGAWQGVLPLVRVRSLLFGDYIVSMPFCNAGGPIGTPEAVRALAAAAREWAEDCGADLLELRSRSAQAVDLTPTRRKLAVVLDLPDAPDVLWRDGLPAKVRSQVRRPQKAGFRFRTGGHLIGAFHAVYREHMRDLGSPALSREMFHGLCAALNGSTRFAVVERDGVPAAAGCGFVWRGRFEITWAAALRVHRRDAPNMLLYWGLMEECIRAGITQFDFGRCSPNSGTHRFKQQWGGRDIPLPWWQWSAHGRTATPTPDAHWRYRLATAAWRRLPLPITNSLGPWFADRIP